MSLIVRRFQSILATVVCSIIHAKVFFFHNFLFVCWYWLIYSSKVRVCFVNLVYVWCMCSHYMRMNTRTLCVYLYFTNIWVCFVFFFSYFSNGNQTGVKTFPLSILNYQRKEDKNSHKRNRSTKFNIIKAINNRRP